MPDRDHSAPPQRRILVADDEPHIRRILATFLEASGFVVERGRGWSPGDGSRFRGPVPYDLALLDIMMPEHTGLEVLEFTPAPAPS